MEDTGGRLTEAHSATDDGVGLGSLAILLTLPVGLCDDDEATVSPVHGCSPTNDARTMPSIPWADDDVGSRF